MDPMGGDSPGGETGPGGETRYQSALAQIIGQPRHHKTHNNDRRSHRGQQLCNHRRLGTCPPGRCRWPNTRRSGWWGARGTPELVDPHTRRGRRGRHRVRADEGATGHGRSDSNANVEALLAMADEISVEVDDPMGVSECEGALGARGPWHRRERRRGPGSGRIYRRCVL